MLKRLVLVLVLLFGFGAAPASAERLLMHYEATAYGFLPFGRAQLQVNIDGGRYQSAAVLRTSGLAALVARANLTASSFGQWGSDGAAPGRYSLDHQYRGHRVSAIEWRDGGVIQTADPPFPDRGDPAPTEAQQRAGRDPLAALLTMSAHTHAERCDGTVRVFDGLYVYDLSLSPAGEGTVELDEVRWRVVKCTLRQRRIAGYHQPSDLNKRMQPGEIWFATDTGAPFAVPVRVSTHLSLGPATVRLTGFSRN
jgi:hypothetical protein